MAQSDLKHALLIAGPTASGKSALALAVARARGGVVINADSMQVYRELRVLTARPSEAELAQVPHRLYGHVAAAEEYSVARWLGEARQAMEACWAAGQLPIVCGGTGLYFRALLMGLADVPEIDPAIRAHWRAYEGDLHAALAARDAEGASRLHPADRQRLRRALEVVEGTGRPLSHYQSMARSSAVLQGVQVDRWFLDVPRATLGARADARLEQMVVQGALDELRALPKLAADRPLLKAIGVPQLLAHVRGELPLEEALKQAKTATRHYIKRQLTWWRGQMPDWQAVVPESALPAHGGP